MVDNYKEELLMCLSDLKCKKTMYRQIPNLLTFSRMIGVIPVNILYFTGNILPALVLSVCLFVTDFFDGKIARKYNIVSSFGAKLDAVCDKVMTLGLAIPLISFEPLILINLLMEGFISGVNIINEKKGYNPKTVYVGKIKTLLLSMTLGFGYLGTVLNKQLSVFKVFSGITILFEGITLNNYMSISKRVEDSLVIDNGNFTNSNNNFILEVKEDKIEYLKKEKENILSNNYAYIDEVKRLKRKR